MISDIKKYFQEHTAASLYDVSLHCGAEESAVEPILDMLVKKQFLKPVDQDCDSGSCGGCFVSDCNPGKMKFYQICD